jgi:PTH1 family peptidyl-tRNA hydrolase
VGFVVLDLLARRLDGAVAEERSGARRLRGHGAGSDLVLVKPLEYMNRSGPPVKAVLEDLQADPTECLVVHDDLDLPLGRIKLKRGGGTGGHRGLESIVAALGRDDFVRLRLGIGRPPAGADAVRHVLEEFAATERALLDGMLDRACGGILSWVENGLEATMNRLNAPRVDLEGPLDGC